jgi:dynein heavy chain
MWKLSYRLTKMFNTVENKGPLKVALTIKNRIEKFKINLPFVQIFCNPGLKQRHWELMNNALCDYITPDETTSLKDFLEKSKIIEKNLDSLTAISEQARKEFALEQALKRMKKDWNTVNFTFIPYKETNFYLFASFEEFQTLLDDQVVKTNTIKNSPFVVPFETEVNGWINDLVNYLFFLSLFIYI